MVIDRRRRHSYSPLVAKKIRVTANGGKDAIRDAILAECQKRGWNRYKLAKLMKPMGVSATTTYHFLADPKGQLRTQTASAFLEALEIKLTPSANKSDATT